MQVINENENINNDFMTIVLKGMLKVGMFNIQVISYVLDLLLLKLSDVLEDKILGKWSWWCNRYLEPDDTQYRVEVLEGTDRHEYKMHRSNEYKKAYDKLESLVKVTNNVTIALDKGLYDDIMQKLNKLLYIVDRESLQNGYRFARDTKLQLDQDEIYKAYLTYQIMKGE